MQVQAVAVTGIGVADVDGNRVARIGEQHRAGHPPVPGRLVHIRRDQRIGDRHRVRGIVIPVVHQRVER